MNKYFIITIDTESDNQWDVHNLQKTENAKFIPRFQDLCEKYDFKPVYLLDYPMANDQFLSKYLSSKIKQGLCEVGCHPHSWSTPPFTKIDKCSDCRPYLYEYSEKEMYDKIQNLTGLIEKNFGVKPISHRAGRWAMDNKYFRILENLGYSVDCSVTPGINWNKQLGFSIGGSNYSRESQNIGLYKNTNILEIPVSIEKIRTFKFEKKINLRYILKSFFYSLFGKSIWMRPSISSVDEIKHLVDKNVKRGSNYIEFMMHSSEFMPGGSPYFTSKEDIEFLFESLENIFAYVKQNNYSGATLEGVYKNYQEKKSGLMRE